jgi:hypothetical protein
VSEKNSVSRRLAQSYALRFGFRYTALAMPVSGRHFAPGQLQFITSSTYRRTKLLDSHRFRCDVVEVLRHFRRETGFLLVGWVLRPQHVQGLGAFAGGMALVELQVLPS